MIRLSGSLRMIRNLGLVAVAGVGLTACVDDGYGYGGMSVGYGAPGYYDGYYDDGYGYGSPYWGWYGDYYYPGTGYYVYDRDRRPHRWNDGQRRYWESRRGNWRGDRGQSNWGGYDRRGDGNRADGNRNWGNGGRDNPQWNGNRRNFTPEQRQQWQQQRGATGARTFTPEQRQQWQDRRAAQGQGTRAYTPEQRQQWQQQRQQNREAYRAGQGQSAQPRASGGGHRGTAGNGGRQRRGGN
jgi:hypothetical protein